MALAEATTAAHQTANHLGYLIGMQNIVASKGDAEAARHFAGRCQEQQRLAEERALSSEARVAQAAAEASEAAINQSELAARITEGRVMEQRAQQELARISAELVRMQGQLRDNETAVAACTEELKLAQQASVSGNACESSRNFMLRRLNPTPSSHLHLCPHSVQKFKGVILGDPLLAAVAAGTPVAESVPLPKFKQSPHTSKQGPVGRAAFPSKADTGTPALPPTKWDGAVMGAGETREEVAQRSPTSPTSPLSGGGVDVGERQRSRSPIAKAQSKGRGSVGVSKTRFGT